MPEREPDKVWLFRIIHINNLEYVLTHGIFTRKHKNADPNYINIGDNKLIGERHEHEVGVNPPGGTLGEYIPFYFGALSPMLFNIKTGYRGITQRPQNDIIYICCKLTDVLQNCTEWCFTDGHAKNKITGFYNSINYLHNVDWDIVGEKYWNPIEEDMDRMRRKQAEFLVKSFVPAQCIHTVIVYDEGSSRIVKDVIERLRIDIRVFIDTKKRYYY